ncbi:MAG: hypothetical protein LBD77_09200 [Bifidobacteriaceae bacterium]|nr:hypothetical protein [Bifidobacteriaceae bacterium]
MRIPVDAGRLALIPTGQDTREIFEYQDGKRTNKPIMVGGQPAYAFEAAVALDGKGMGSARVESGTATLPPLDFGTVLGVQGSAALVVSPLDQFHLRLKLLADRVVSRTSGGGQPGDAAPQPYRAPAVHKA